MKIKPSITVATIQVAVALAVMWACLAFWGHAHANTCYAPVGSTSGRALGIATNTGNAMLVIGFPGLVMIWVLAKEYRKTINEQQDQINELKSELEKMKQDRDNGT